MRIPVPSAARAICREFAYLGDATRHAARSAAPTPSARFIEYVYLRDNPAGPHREFWYHVSGCRSWLVVTRDTRTHEILAEPQRPQSRRDHDRASVDRLPKAA